MKAKVLYLEDDATLGFLTTDSLNLHGYEVTFVDDGSKALDLFKQGEFDLCILDIVVPGLNGMEVSRKIREIDSTVPLIFLSARALVEDRIEALKTGADDYLVKPFRMEELILKMEVFLRRSGKVQPPIATQFSTEVSLFKPAEFKLSVGEDAIRLTARENELLQFLWEHQNNVVKREDILLKIWGDDDYFLGRSLDVFISRLRKYLKADENIQIDNVHGVGFQFKTAQS